jgi:hypothetical protein
MYTPKGSAYGLGGPRKGSRPNTPLSGSLRTPLLVGRLKTSSQGGSTPLSRWEFEAWDKQIFAFGRSAWKTVSFFSFKTGIQHHVDVPSIRVTSSVINNFVSAKSRFTESKKRGDEVIPMEFNRPSVSWISFNGIQNLGPYFAHLRKRKKAYHTKMICREKKPISVRKLTEVTQIKRIDFTN